MIRRGKIKFRVKVGEIDIIVFNGFICISRVYVLKNYLMRIV